MIATRSTTSPEFCHCGQLVHTHEDGLSRGMCANCDSVRCDAFPGACAGTQSSRRESVMTIILPVERGHDLLDEIANFAMERASALGMDAIVTSTTESVTS
jgi:hypothetical protein